MLGCDYMSPPQTSEIHRHLGVCPQFDIHHPELTAKEHLLFYARLKGVKRSKEMFVVDRALREVGRGRGLRVVRRGGAPERWGEGWGLREVGEGRGLREVGRGGASDRWGGGGHP